MKPRKALERRGLATAFFLSKLFHWKDQADIELECFRCFHLWIFAHLCVLFLRFELPIQFDETMRKMFSTVDKEDVSSVDKGAEQDRLR